MISRISRFATFSLIASVLAIVSGVSCPSASATDHARPNLTVTDSGLASGPTVVHLRRLHLVRPDLIPYPIDYEVVC